MFERAKQRYAKHSLSSQNVGSNEAVQWIGRDCATFFQEKLESLQCAWFGAFGTSVPLPFALINFCRLFITLHASYGKIHWHRANFHGFMTGDLEPFKKRRCSVDDGNNDDNDDGWWWLLFFSVHTVIIVIMTQQIANLRVVFRSKFRNGDFGSQRPHSMFSCRVLFQGRVAVGPLWISSRKRPPWATQYPSLLSDFPRPDPGA